MRRRPPVWYRVIVEAALILLVVGLLMAFWLPTLIGDGR